MYCIGHNTPMSKIVFPLSVRRKALRMFSDGHPGPKIAKMLGCSKETVKSWCKEAKVLSKSGLTEEELDQKIVEWGLHPKFDDSRAVMANEAENKRKRHLIRKSHQAKFGPSPMEGRNALKSFKQFGDPDEYQKAVDAWLVQTMHELYQAETLEGQFDAMAKGALLKQLSGAIQALPAILNTTDLVNNLKMLRTFFGMDKEKDTDKVRIDLTILNGKVAKPKQRKVIDVPSSESD